MSLLKFFFTEKCTNCGERIEKGAQFCRHCGAGRANSWRKCNTCGVSVAADSQFCWSCKANVAAQPRDDIFSDRWRRTPGVFAIRVTIETPQDRLRNGIQVDEGTLGALYSNGVLKTKLGAGYHSQTSFWDRLMEGGKTGGFIEAIIAVMDPVSSLVSFSGTSALYTKDFVAVEAAVLVKIQLADFGVFSRRMLPAGSDLVRDDDLMLPHNARVAEVLRRHLSRLGVAEAARSTELRHEIEAALGAELPGLLEGYGLRFGGVEDVRLDSPEISRVREAEGGLSKTERELGWNKKKRELQQSHKLVELKDEFAFKEQLDQWTHEYSLTTMEREHIVGMRRIQLGEAQRAAATHAEGRVRNLEKDYEIDIKKKDRNWEDEEDRRDLGMMDEMRKRQFEAMEKLQKLNLEKASADTKNTIDLGQGLKDVPSAIAAGVLPTDHGNQVIRALEVLRPLPDVLIISSTQTYAPPGYAPPGYGPPGYPPGYPVPQQPSFMPSYAPGITPPSHPGMGSYGAGSLEALAQRYLPSVGVIVAGMETGRPIPMGTGWVVSGRGVVVTNAHVAEGVIEANAQAGMSAWIIFSGQSQPCRIRRATIHPEYAQNEARGYSVPSHDLAVLELETTTALPGLPLASRPKLYALRELQPAAYLGFPMENLAGGGTNLERPKAIAKKGSISSLEDWHMRHTDNPTQRQLIKHDLGVAGGASGSPMFDEAGDVIGVVSAGNMERLYDPQTKQFHRIPNGVVLNFAQRLDLLLDWMGW